MRSILSPCLLFVSVEQVRSGSHGGAACDTDLQCNLNGVCSAGACVCDTAWIGTNCSTLHLLPSPTNSGLRQEGSSTWGGSVIQVDGNYHMYAAEIVSNCGLTSWQTNSLTVHAVSESPVGPYRFSDIASGIWSHNPIAAVASDGTLLLMHAGFGGYDNSTALTCEPTGCCKDGTSPCGFHTTHRCNSSHPTWPTKPYTPGPDPNQGHPNFTIRAATSPEGPWDVLTVNLTGDSQTHTFTPAMLAFPNGTVLALLGMGGLFRANHWRGPYERYGAKLFWGCGGEDAHLYVDSRGGLHCIFHAGPYSDLTVAGGHAFSADGGFTWHTQPTPAWPGHELEVIQGDGTVKTVPIAKRERPHLIFNKRGQPVALSTAVCEWDGDPETPMSRRWALCNNNPWPGHFDRTFTHVQPIYHEEASFESPQAHIV